MSFIGSMLSGSNGAGFQAQSANPVTDANSQAAMQQAQAGIGSQQNLVNALAAQNGIQNQSQVYNQLQGVANGTGPNPAQAQLAQATGANVANQASLMAGQRGAGANTGLIARQAAQQGAATQQQAAGQAATLQAQQSLGAIGQAGGMANQMVGNQVGAQQYLTGANLANQQNILGAQTQNIQQQNQYNATVAAGNQKAQAGLVNALGSALVQIPNMLGGAAGSSLGGAAGSSLIGAGGAAGSGLAAGSVIGDVAPVAEGALMVAAGGGEVTDLTSEANAPQMMTPGTNTPESAIDQQTSIHSQFLKGLTPRTQSGMDTTQSYAKGGKVNALLSPGEKVLSPKEAQAAKAGVVNPMAAGKEVPGKPKVGGAKNSYANDTVPAKLTPGSVVLPRSVTQSDDPASKAKKFVEALKSKKGK